MTRMDENDLRLLTGVSFSRATKARYVRQSADLSAEAQRRLDEVVLQEPRAIQVTGRLDDASLSRLVPCGGSSPSLSAPAVGRQLPSAASRFRAVPTPQFATGSGCTVSLDDLETMSARVARLDEPEFERAIRMLRQGESTAGTRLVADIDEKFVGQLMRFDDRNIDFERWTDWRESLAEANSRVDSTEIEDYVNNVRQAGELDNVDNPEGLVREFANNPKQFQGQSGEAASAVRYANRGDEVTVEPGSGRFDLGLNAGDEFVEVKTRRGAVDSRWVEDQILETLEKVDGASVAATNDNAVLEIRIRGSTQTGDEIADAIQGGVQRSPLSGDANIGDIRVIVDGQQLN